MARGIAAVLPTPAGGVHEAEEEEAQRSELPLPKQQGQRQEEESAVVRGHAVAEGHSQHQGEATHAELEPGLRQFEEDHTHFAERQALQDPDFEAGQQVHSVLVRDPVEARLQAGGHRFEPAVCPRQAQLCVFGVEDGRGVEQRPFVEFQLRVNFHTFQRGLFL